LPHVPINAAALAALDAAATAAGGGSGSAGAGENSQAETYAAHTKRKRSLSGGVQPSANGHNQHLAGSSQLVVGSAGGSGACSLATLADSSLEAAAAASASSKGLKHFSLKVCEKVEGKGCTNYNVVADELVRDMLVDSIAEGAGSEGGSGNPSLAAAAMGPHDDKNIRRRVYDALNVLEALGIIAKTKRDIEWRGWPPALRKTYTEKDRLEAERARLAARIQFKAETTNDVATKAFCLSNLVLRNRDAPLCALITAQELGMMAPNPLALPFMLVHAPESAEVDIDITPDEKTAQLNFHHHPFQIFDDERVMRMMGLGEPQPELAAAIFGTSAAAIDNNTNIGVGVVKQDPLAGAPTDFVDVPPYHQQHQVVQLHQREMPLPPPPQAQPLPSPPPPQQQQQQQEEPVDMSDTPLKNTTVVGVPATLNPLAVLSPSAGVSAMALGPDDSTTPRAVS
jgi:hypothetical protein